MGFASLFQQAGVINEASSTLTSISTNSGSTWFGTQLFYSAQFFNRLISTNDTTVPSVAVRDFVIEWMTSYAEFQGTVPPSPDCKLLNITPEIPELQELASMCNLLIHCKFS